MTTDVAPEVETPTLVTQDSPPEIDATPVGDADPQVVADAAPAPQAADLASIEAEADAWLKEQEGKGSEQQAPEPEQSRGVDPAVAQEAIRRFREGYGTRQQRLDALAKRLEDAGYSKLEVEAISKETKDILNEHHADSLQYAGYEAVQQERLHLASEMYAGLSKSTVEKIAQRTEADTKAGKTVPYRDIFKHIQEIAREEGKAEGVKEGRKEGFIAGRSFGERTQSSASSGQSVQGDPAGGGKRYADLTAEEKASMSDSALNAIAMRDYARR